MDYRISKLREYLLTIIDTLTTNRKYQINANMLSNKVDDYSIDKIPVQSTVEQWIIGPTIHRDVYSFRSRKSYGQDVLTNLKNIGFFEALEELIKEKNDERILPEIEGVESIRCLNSGTMISNDDGKTAVFDIQIEVTYREN